MLCTCITFFTCDIHVFLERLDCFSLTYSSCDRLTVPTVHTSDSLLSDVLLTKLWPCLIIYFTLSASSLTHFTSINSASHIRTQSAYWWILSWLDNQSRPSSDSTDSTESSYWWCLALGDGWSTWPRYWPRWRVHYSASLLKSAWNQNHTCFVCQILKSFYILLPEYSIPFKNRFPASF